MPLSKVAPVVFCATTIRQARQSAWSFVQEGTESTPLDPPLVLASPLSFAAWRDMARKNGGVCTGLPRLSAPELFFARAHGANVRANWLGGVPRLWALSSVLHRLENRFSLLDFDADDTDALKAMAALIADMRRQNLRALPVESDAFGSELDQWRAGYDAHLEEINAFDFEGAPALFAQSVKRNRTFALPPTLVIDDTLDIFPSLAVGLNALLGRARHIVATLALPNGWGDEASARAHQFWTEHGAQFRFVEEKEAPSFRLHVAKALLSEQSEVNERPSHVSLTNAHTMWDEWERIASHIRARLDEGALPRNFCLVLPTPSVQEPLMRAAFEAHGVPLAGGDSTTSGSPLIERLLRLVVIPPRSQWSVDALHDIFGDGALRLEWPDDESILRRFDAGRLRRAHRSIRGEKDEAAWRDPVALARDWESRIGRLRDSLSGQGDEARATLLARSLDGGDLEGVARLKTQLLPFQEARSCSEWTSAVLNLCDALTPHLAESDEQDEVERRAQTSLKKLRWGIEELKKRAGEDDSARPSGRWAAWLRLELASGAWEANSEDETPIEGVRVLSSRHVGEAGSEGEREIFVTGLTERAWPLPPATPLWPATTVQALKILSEGEPAPIAWALHGLSRLIATDAHLHLSHPTWLDTNEVEASPLIEDLRALFHGESWPELARPETYPTPTSRAQWLRRHSQGASRDTDDEFQLCLDALGAMREGRNDSENWGHYDGVLGERGRELLAPLMPHEGDKLELSASGAELYARCGLHFFFERVLRLPDDSQTEDDLSRPESGDLVHRILQAFHREWSAPLSLQNFEAAKAALEIHVRRECERLGLPPILRRAEARRLLGTPKRDGALVRLLRAECHENDARRGQATNGTFADMAYPLVHLQSGAFVGISNFDWRLGERGNGLEQPFRIPLDGVTIRGRIDRIDAAEDGTWLLVLDYKTGSASSLPSFVKSSDRLHFQLGVYIMATHYLTQEWPTHPRVAAAYLSPRAGFAGVVAPADLLALSAKGAMDETNQAKWLADTRSQIERIAALIESGTFNLSLRTSKVARCEWCAHQALCGQNASIQTARAAVQTESNVVFYPSPIEWNAAVIGEEN